MKIGFVGWGERPRSEIVAAYDFYGPEHQYVIGSEEPRNDFPTGDNIEIHALTNPREPGLVGNVTDLSYLDYFGDCDLIIYPAAAHKNLEKKFAPNDPIWSRLKTTQELFFEMSPSANLVGVTGTKGKGTTSTLIHMMIEAAGLRSTITGNIGNAVFNVIKDIQPDDWVVLELSSFQLYKFPYSPHIAVHLMMMPEHIEEWHKTMDDYVESKANIFAHQTEADFAIYYPANQFSRDNVELSKGKHIPYAEPPGAYLDVDGNIVIDNQKIVHRSELKLLGDHNIQNICAAVTAVWQIHQNTDAIRSVLTTFSGLEHRLELAGTVNDVRYYDDSFGTTPDTAIVAMDAFAEPKVMIVGGHEKGNPFEAMAARLAGDDIRHVVFIGTTARKIYDLAVTAGFNPNKASIKDDGNSWTIDEIVKTAQQHAQPGDVVLLSTGCASFGLFKDYKERGNLFKSSVAGL